MQLHGPDWVFEIDNRAAIRIAMSVLRKHGQQITVQSVATVSGLSVPVVVATMRQMQAEHKAKEQGNA